MKHTTNNLRKARELRRVKTEDLIKKTGLKYETFYKVEKQTSGMRIGTLIKISNALKLTPDYIMGLTEEPKELKENIYPTNIKNNVVKILKNKGLINDAVNFNQLDKQVKDFNFIMLPRLSMTSNINSVLPLVDILGVSLTEIISCPASEKLAKLQTEIKLIEKELAEPSVF